MELLCLAPFTEQCSQGSGPGGSRAVGAWEVDRQAQAMAAQTE